jgi:hypothetical protein
MYTNTSNSRSGETMSKWQADLDQNEVLVKNKRISIGCDVETEHGTGKVVGRNHPYRIVVEITNPIDKHKGLVSRFEQARLCYFPKEIDVL